MQHTRVLAPSLTIFVFGVAPSFGADILWDGGGVTDIWSNPQNWAGDVLPGVGDRAVFDDDEQVLDRMALHPLLELFPDPVGTCCIGRCNEQEVAAAPGGIENARQRISGTDQVAVEERTHAAPPPRIP